MEHMHPEAAPGGSWWGFRQNGGTAGGGSGSPGLWLVGVQAAWGLQLVEVQAGQG